MADLPQSFKTDYKIEFDDRAQAISGMSHAVCDAYQEAARFDLEYNGELGHSSRRAGLHCRIPFTTIFVTAPINATKIIGNRNLCRRRKIRQT